MHGEEVGRAVVGVQGLWGGSCMWWQRRHGSVLWAAKSRCGTTLDVHTRDAKEWSRSNTWEIGGARSCAFALDDAHQWSLLAVASRYSKRLASLTRHCGRPRCAVASLPRPSSSPFLRCRVVRSLPSRRLARSPRCLRPRALRRSTY